MATAKKSVPVSNEPDLLDDVNAPETEDDDSNESFDMLDELDQTNGVAWTPSDDEDMPRAIQGVVTYEDEIQSDYEKDGEFPVVSLIEITPRKGTRDPMPPGDDAESWSVRGYHTVLESQLKRARKKVGGALLGHIIAIGYTGETPPKVKGRKPTKNYVVKAV